MTLLHRLQSLTPSQYWAWLCNLTATQRIVQTGMWLVLAAFYALYLHWKYNVRVRNSKRVIDSNEQWEALRRGK